MFSMWGPQMTGLRAWIAGAIRNVLPDALPVIVPRHAERRAEVKQDLERAGFEVLLRSQFNPLDPFAASGNRPLVLLIDSTGELRDWMAHADAVIIGKSFLAKGGQNPTEAILARKPVICGPHMENFEPLASHLSSSHGCLRAMDATELSKAILTALEPKSAASITDNATQVLVRHAGATQRILTLLCTLARPQK
jgi:3-deoxy-D-manno-octulosonic-acid transferase